MFGLSQKFLPKLDKSNLGNWVEAHPDKNKQSNNTILNLRLLSSIFDWLSNAPLRGK